jgi:hypothetical protein
MANGIVDLQILQSSILARDYTNNILTPRFSFRPTYTTQVALTLPVIAKMTAVQPRSYEFTNGTGDISADGSMNLGLSGQYSLQFSLTLPTGQYDIRRGSDATSYILPAGAQLITASQTIIISRTLGLDAAALRFRRMDG